MIFFMVMPALIGGFGGVKNLSQRLLGVRKISKCNLSKNQLGYYLAGLIEGDGTIYISKEGRPVIEIVFNKEDKLLAEKIKDVLGGGSIKDLKSKACVLNINDKRTILKLVELINGKLRTPKIEALHRIINWLNKNQDKLIPMLDLDKSNLGSNAWLSGFIESDGTFYFTFKTKDNGIATELINYMRITQRQSYHRESLGRRGTSYFPIMESLADFIGQKIEIINRRHKKDNRLELGYIVRSSSIESNKVIDKYLQEYPLFSSKYLNYKAWSRFFYIRTNKLYKSPEITLELAKLKEGYNTKRIEFSWGHLDNFYKS